MWPAVVHDVRDALHSDPRGRQVARQWTIVRTGRRSKIPKERKTCYSYTGNVHVKLIDFN